MKHTKNKLPRTIKRDLVLSIAIFALWTYVVQTFVPASWISAWPVPFEILITLSPFAVAAVMGYEFLFREVGLRFSRATYAVVFSIIVFLLSMGITWVIPIFPASMLDNIALGDVFVTLWMMLFYLLSAGLVLWFIHATAPIKRGKARRA